MYVCTVPYLPRLYPCTLPTAPVSRSFGLRSSYEIDILDIDQRPRNKSLRLEGSDKYTVPGNRKTKPRKLWSPGEHLDLWIPSKTKLSILIQSLNNLCWPLCMYVCECFTKASVLITDQYSESVLSTQKTNAESRGRGRSALRAQPS